MHLSNICADRRSEDNNLKTQLRFGNYDIEVFVKYKNREEGFKRVSLKDFTDIDAIPKFDDKLKWKRYIDRPQRTKASIHREELGKRPSTLPHQLVSEDSQNPRDNQTDSRTLQKNLVRANSNSTSNVRKRQKLYSAASSNDEDMDASKSDASSDKEDIDGTPTSRKNSSNVQ